MTSGGPQGAIRPFPLSPKPMAVVLGAAILAFVLGHAVAVWIDWTDREDRRGFHEVRELLHMDGEGNAPTWFAAALLLVCAVLALAIGLGEDRARRRWWSLAGVLAFLSLDEAALIHDRLSEPTTALLGLDEESWVYWAWVIPYAVLTVALAVWLLPFVWRLPSATRRLLLLGAAVFVAGAAGMELVGREVCCERRTLSQAIAGVEETLELAGAAITAVGLAAHLERHVGSVAVVRRG